MGVTACYKSLLWKEANQTKHFLIIFHSSIFIHLSFTNPPSLFYYYYYYSLALTEWEVGYTLTDTLSYPLPKMDQLNDLNSLSNIKGLKLVHLNVRSILGKIDQLILNLMDSKIEIITLSETWLHEALPTHIVELNGYTGFRQDRSGPGTKSRGGGLITYIKNQLADYTITLSKLNSCTPHLEAQWMKVERPTVKNIILCNMYRPPEGDLSKAIEYLNKCIQQLNSAKCDIFILGDWNVNYKNTLSPEYKKITCFENGNNLRQIIRETTRNTDKTKTLLDLILTNADNIADSGTLDMFISDHQPVYVIKKKSRNISDSREFEGRQYKNLDTDSLLNNLAATDWGQLYKLDDPQEAWSTLHELIKTELDRQCPVRKTKIKQYIPDWIDPDLRSLIRDRDYFYKKAKMTGKEDDWNIAKHLRNVANAGVRSAKALYVKRKLEEYAKDGAKFSRTSQEHLSSKKSKNSNLKISLTDPATNEQIPEADTADFINDYFINIGRVTPPHNRQRNIRSCRKRVNTSYTPKNNRTNDTHPSNDQAHAPPWSISTFTEEEVLKIVKDIDTNKSSGLQHISNTVLKSIFKILVEQITHIFNLSMKTGSFPNSWKQALVVPIPKTGDLSSVANFCPISLLPQPGKLLEKLVHNKLSKYIEDNDLLSNKQHGFRKSKSTLDALFQLTNQINLNMDRRNITLTTFIDFKKAFDCVQHSLLVKKLKNLNLDDITVKWLENYLTNRQQKVRANGYESAPLNVEQGVPQGSIVGPLMYIIYANDIAGIMKKCEVSMYADDTAIFSNCHSVKLAQSRMQASLKALEQWCSVNGIYINVKKTKYMLFGSKVALAKYKDTEIKLKIGKETISRANNYCYLGVILDEQLNYESHAQNTFRKVKSKLSQLRAMRYCLNKKAMTLIYKNMILPILEYGNIFLSSLSKGTQKAMQVLQNKALKIALNLRHREKTNFIHKEASLDKLEVRRKIHTLQFVFKRKNQLHLLVRFPVGRITRSSKKIKFKLRKPVTEKYKASLSYKGFKLWNQLPASIQTIEDIKCFKHKIKTLPTIKKQIQIECQ